MFLLISCSLQALCCDMSLQVLCCKSTRLCTVYRMSLPEVLRQGDKWNYWSDKTGCLKRVENGWNGVFVLDMFIICTLIYCLGKCDFCYFLPWDSSPWNAPAFGEYVFLAIFSHHLKPHMTCYDVIFRAHEMGILRHLQDPWEWYLYLYRFTMGIVFSSKLTWLAGKSPIFHKRYIFN